jgi:transposase
MKTCMKEPNQNRSRRKFDKTFKREAVELWLRSGKSAKEVGSELGIDESRLYLWKKSFAPELPGGRGSSGAKPVLEDVVSENEALRRENEYLRQQRDILKKTLGILSEPPNSGIKGSR